MSSVVKSFVFSSKFVLYSQVDSADIVRAILAAGANCTVKNTQNLNAFAYCQSDGMKNAYVGELMQAVSQCRLVRRRSVDKHHIFFDVSKISWKFLYQMLVSILINA